ncbi:hypothetical protein [Amycolatopsis pithecellobii]|uniref:Uncharacterized protein n=1 Tax=Amycolatopsis pithecellobii TaxID=664692 RepID=A0A6N7ZBH3_9PSEU|nr:hypothetical protein [Amycolatopsis pithecellobii]MTD59080.1 hypothetical protein [Amycolatopsis pithecellobii]
MLFFVLILVLAALGLLVTALITASSLWAWVSIALSVAAGLLLVVDFLRRRAKRAEVVEEPDETGEPAVEATSEEDAEAVAKLDAEVVVVDEHPRYHLTDCGWLGERDTIPITIKDARDLGFTPCARCSPDAKLLATSES